MKPAAAVPSDRLAGAGDRPRQKLKLSNCEEYAFTGLDSDYPRAVTTETSI